MLNAQRPNTQPAMWQENTVVKSRARLKTKKSPLPDPTTLIRGRTDCLPGQLIALTDSVRTPDVLALSRSLPRGAIIILRHYDAMDREALARSLRRLTRQRRQLLFVSGDHRLARRIGADGLHIRRTDLFANRPPWSGLISAACHDMKAIKRSQQIGADYLLVSPLFTTRSHPDQKPLGFYRWTYMTSWHHREHYVALGGVNIQTARPLSSLSVARKPSGLAAIDGLT